MRSNYTGVIYAQSECGISGTPVLNSQVICNNLPESPGARDIVTENFISGAAAIDFDCQAGISGPRRFEDWYARL
jgi:hypothetical protein